MSDTIEISTTLKRCYDFPEAFDFNVLASPLIDIDGDVGAGDPIASLKGVMCDAGCLPHEEREPYFSVLDSRTAHAYEAFHLFETQVQRILSALREGATDEEYSGIILLERAEVRPEYRSQKIALRLMRETRAVLGGYGRIAILKAHPDGDDISDADLVRLADYYQSDRVCRFQTVSPKDFPGWLVADWEDGGAMQFDKRWL